MYVTGSINGSSPSFDIATVKYSSAGAQQWVKTFNGAKDSADVGNAIALDGQGNVYVAGATTGATSSYDFITIKYTPSGAVSNMQNQTLQAPVYSLSNKNQQPFQLGQNYPNPFRAVTAIDYYLPKACDVRFLISDIKGQLIREIRKNNMPAGRHSIEINSKELVSGTYSYKIVTCSYTATKGMILIK